jgi:hypothetical protein
MRCNIIIYTELGYFAVNKALKSFLYRSRSTKVNFLSLNFGQCTVYSIILVCLGNFQINVLKYIDKIEGVPWLIVKWG